MTWVLYGLLAVYGYFLYGFGPAVPLLRAEEHTSAAVSGLHSTALAGGAVIAGVFGTVVIERWGRGRALWGSMTGMCVGTVIFCASPLLPVTLTGALVAGTFGSVMVNTTSAGLSDHHRQAAPAAISEANALASAVGLVAPLVIGAAVSIGLGWRAGLLSILLVSAAFAAVQLRVPLPDHRGDPRGDRGDHPDGEPARPGRRSGRQSRRLSGQYWWAWTAMVMCISLEFCLTIWCSDLLRERSGLSAGVAATGVTAIVAGMAIGRLAGGRIALYRPVDWLLYRALALHLAGFALFWLSTIGWLSFCGLFIAGLGLSLLFPLTIARAIGFSDGRPDLATARTSLGAGLAVGGGPFLLGALSDAFGTHRGFLLVPVLVLAAALGVLMGSRTGTGSAPAPPDGRDDQDARPAGDQQRE